MGFEKKKISKIDKVRRFLGRKRQKKGEFLTREREKKNLDSGSGNKERDSREEKKKAEEGLEGEVMI